MRAAILAAVLGLTVTRAEVAAAQQLPQVEVTFVTQSHDFHAGLAVQERDRRVKAADAIDKLERTIADAAWRKFGFLEWRRASRGNSPKLRLVVELYEDLSSGVPTYRLFYHRQDGDKLTPIWRGELDWPLWEPGVQHFFNWPELSRTVILRVSTDLKTGRSEFMKHLKTIALCERQLKPRVEHERKAIDVPLPWNAMHSGSGSTLKVVFETRKNIKDTRPVKGHITLTGLDACAEQGFVEGKFGSMEHPELDRLLQAGDWDPKVRSLLHADRVVGFTVTMHEYEPSDGWDTDKHGLAQKP